MAFFHANINIISRSAGHSAVAAAAYRAGEDLGEHKYAKRGGVVGSEILYPADAPAWLRGLSRRDLWESVESAEKRKDAQLARAGDFALPRELSWEQNKELTRGFIREFYTAKGMVVDVAYHEGKNGENPHIHPMAPMRRAEANGWGKKERAWNEKSWLEAVRAGWEEHVNAALERAGIDARIDHRTLAAQGIDREPQRHRGKYHTQIRRLDAAMSNEIEELERNRDGLVAEIAKIETLEAQTAKPVATKPAPKKRYDPTAPSADYYARKAAAKAAQSDPPQDNVDVQFAGLERQQPTPLLDDDKPSAPKRMTEQEKRRAEYEAIRAASDAKVRTKQTERRREERER